LTFIDFFAKINFLALNFRGENMSTWICDSCGTEILCADDGWVEWIKLPNKSGRNLRLVHGPGAGPGMKCRFDSKEEYKKDNGTLADLPLTEFLGPDGLIKLLVMIEEKEPPLTMVLEMIKRLHIPGYEHARKHFEAALSEGIIEPNLPDGYYWQSQIKATLEYMKRKS
jgi:hypothetical protein